MPSNSQLASLIGKNTFMGPIFKTCKSCFIKTSSWYIIYIALQGLLIYGQDLWCLFFGTSSSSSLWHNRIQTRGTRIVSEPTERNLKVGFALLALEHHFLLIMAVLKGISMLMIPWMIIESTVFVLEVFLYFLRFALQKSPPKSRELFVLFFLLLNITQVYCYFCQTRITEVQNSGGGRGANAFLPRRPC